MPEKTTSSSQPASLPRQPRSVSLEPVKSRGEHYKAGWHTERQKFEGRPSREIIQEAYQKELFDLSIPEERAAESFGLILSMAEDRALSALQNLLSRTEYQGNRPGQENIQTDFGQQPLIRLVFTWSEYFEAYGLEKRNGKYSGKAYQEAREALETLGSQVRTVGIKSGRYEDQGPKRRKVFDYIVSKRPLIDLTKLYKGLSPEEGAEVEAGKPLLNRVTKLVVEVSGLLLYEIEKNFVIKPANLYREIEECLKGKKGTNKNKSQAISLFIQYLLTLDLPEIQMKPETLAEILRLDYYLRNRKRKELKKRFQECFETALELDYLLEEVTENVSGNFVFKLNPDRCKRLGFKKEKQEARKAKALLSRLQEAKE